MFECFGDKQCFGGMFCATLRPDMQQILSELGALGRSKSMRVRAWPGKRVARHLALRARLVCAGAGRTPFGSFDETLFESS